MCSSDLRWARGGRWERARGASGRRGPSAARSERLQALTCGVLLSAAGRGKRAKAGPAACWAVVAARWGEFGAGPAGQCEEESAAEREVHRWEAATQGLLVSQRGRWRELHWWAARGDFRQS